MICSAKRNERSDAYDAEGSAVTSERPDMKWRGGACACCEAMRDAASMMMALELSSCSPVHAGVCECAATKAVTQRL